MSTIHNTDGVVRNPLSDRAERIIELNAELVGETCDECGRTIEAVDVAKGVDPDPAHGVRVDVDTGDILLAHAGFNYCEVQEDQLEQ